jgi:hypothetical protein
MLLDGVFAFLDGAVAAADKNNGLVVRALGVLLCAGLLIGGAILLYDALA